MLVADDDPLTTTLVERVLTACGCAVEIVASGAEALAAVERHRPDLIVLDIVMPQMSGMEVLDRLKSNPRLAAIPVILLTAKANDEDLLEGYRFGADYYVTKPFRPAEIEYGVAMLLGRDVVRPASAAPPTRKPSA